MIGPTRDKSQLSSFGTVAIKISNLHVSNLNNKYKDVFPPGMGEIKRVKSNIAIKPGAYPKLCGFRPVPFTLQEQVEGELDQWIRDDIAYKITNSQWSTPFSGGSKA